MNQQSSFAVSRFKNRNGVHSFRVEGRLNGVRIRRNYKSQEEAAAEKAALELKALQLESNLRSITTVLTEEQVREAETLFRRLAGDTRSLAFCVDYTLAHHREPAERQPLVNAVAEYLGEKTRDHKQNLISDSQLTTIKRHLAVLRKYFPSVAVADFTAGQIATYCRRGNVGLKTYNNRRGVLSTFFKFAFQNDWIVSNPIHKVPHHRIAHRRGSAETLTAAQAQALMAYVEDYQGGRLVPFFALCLFAGIRPCLRTGEILKLTPEKVRLDTGVILVEPEVSKVRMKRNVTIQPNLAAWLHAYPLEKNSIIPANLQHLRADIAKKFQLTHDVMRHTFISMFVAKFRSMGEAALQAGNSESIIRKHYLDLKSLAEAEQFFGILPKKAAEQTSPPAPPAPSALATAA